MVLGFLAQQIIKKNQVPQELIQMLIKRNLCYDPKKNPNCFVQTTVFFFREYKQLDLS